MNPELNGWARAEARLRCPVGEGAPSLGLSTGPIDVALSEGVDL
jgi:hypothetical protein